MLSLSLSVLTYLRLCFAVWAYVDKGTSGNLKQADQMNHDATKPYKVIVSRSHTGEVTPVLKESLGENTEVTYAGGAGE